MQSRSYKILPITSFAIFVIAGLMLIFSQVVTYASRRVQVRDKDGHVVGEAWIPHDYDADACSSISLVVLSGIQLWTIRTIGKAAYVSAVSQSVPPGNEMNGFKMYHLDGCYSAAH